MYSTVLNVIKVIFSLLVIFGTSFGHAEPKTLANDPIIFPVLLGEIAAINACHQRSNGLYQSCRSCLEEAPTSGTFMNYTILVHALSQSAFPFKIEPLVAPNSERSRRLLISGKATIRGDWDFNIDGKDYLYKSDAFILPDIVEKGLYRLPSNERLQQIRSASDLAVLSAAINPYWRLDWQFLNGIQLSHLTKATTLDQTFQLIKRRGIDFTLLEFSSRDDLAHYHQGIRLVPAPNIKVVLPNTQHFAISKKYPRARQLRDTINSGLNRLHNNGFIEKCLIDSGFINPVVSDWVVLNPHTKSTGSPKIIH